jgi:hypothetical protein
MVVRIESIASQLLLKHSLRIRTTVSPASHRGSEGGGEQKEEKNVVGTINNLVTSDLAKVFEARDWLMIGEMDFLRFDLVEMGDTECCCSDLSATADHPLWRFSLQDPGLEVRFTF